MAGSPSWMRPIYETAEDVSREQSVADHLATKWGARVVKNPRFYSVDWCVLKEGKNLAAFLEVKCRTHAHGQFPTLMVSLHKIAEGLALSEIAGVPFLLGVSFAGDIWWCRVMRRHYPVSMGGRTDRGDTQDIEPVVEIPIEDFRQ